ncbi:hypothetical protein GO986_09030 [Deinococcus sp. HMF7620]|uniref:Uncharacterized protein n=1 Tax=Deinococcus arboris TaxID=2682977 RepID=A0A7C9HRQ8_9DEIO|nr:hypothetical protein [Deinococcus arboris]MVN86907.1 hypothetical protein [Deinococcus arboris]
MFDTELAEQLARHGDQAQACRVTREAFEGMCAALGVPPAEVQTEVQAQLTPKARA